MSLSPSWLRQLCLTLAVAGLALSTTDTADAQGRRARNRLKEPVYRVSKALEPPEKPIEHALDPALKLARDGLQGLRAGIRDYSCILVKRERVKGVLNDREQIYTEVRNRQVVDGKVVAPFSVYMRFISPEKVRGREVIFVEGRNNGKLVAREAGSFMKVLPPVWLRPEGAIAMRGQLYPITDVGLEQLVVKLIERGEQDKACGPCQVKFTEGAAINGRKCTLLEVMHPEPDPRFEFYVAQVFIDDELNVPVRYAAYSWPKADGGKPELLEEYTYLKIKTNIGLDDSDFDHTQKFRKL